MGTHDRAWAGLTLLVYGKRPMAPMQIEQAVANASPANEVKIESFEEYDDALDFCKSQRDVGFVLLHENCGNLPTADVFRQLAKPYEKKGWPCFGVLIHDGTESITGLKTMQQCSNLLKYISIQDLLDKRKTALILDDVWENFSIAFQRHVIPRALEETFLSLAKPELTTTDVHFMDRVNTLLAASLNLSWIETISLRWAPIVGAVRNRNPSALEPHEALVQICSLSNSSSAPNDMLEIFQTKTTLCTRLGHSIVALNRLRQNKMLDSFLKTLGTQNKPGAPALLRLIVNERDKILQIAHEEEAATYHEAAG